jgi:hypothetical protein
MNINEAFSSDESKEIYDKFLAIVNSRRDNLVKKYGREAERVAYSTAVNQVKKKAANSIEEPTTEEPMDQEQKLKEMIQAALSKPLNEFETGEELIADEPISEDLDIGHQDDEPHMIKSELYQIGKYAMDLYKMMDGFEGEQEVDFPAWLQSKITTAKNMMSSVKHYIDFELKEPQIDDIVNNASLDEKMSKKQVKKRGEIYDTLKDKGMSDEKAGKIATSQAMKTKLKKVIKEKLNFILGPTIDGDPNKPMEDDFKISFRDPRKAIMTIMKINSELKQKGIEPIDYNNVGIIFNNPSNQQMQAILNAFNDSDVESVGRVLKEYKK